MKKIPAKNLEKLSNGLLPGDIILLWRIDFGTFTTESWFPKYFTQDYGIDAPAHLRELLAQGYVELDDIYSTLEAHVSGEKIREVLFERLGKKFSGASKLELLDLAEMTFSQKELEESFEIRGYSLTEKGEKALQEGAEVVARITSRCFDYLERPVERVTGLDVPYPPPGLEHLYLPNEEKILGAIATLYAEND